MQQTQKEKFLQAVAAAMDVYKIPNVLLIYFLSDESLNNSTLCADEAEGGQGEKFLNLLSDQLQDYLLHIHNSDKN